MMNYSIVHGDSLTELKKISSGSVDLIVTSPPYNIGKSYETKTSIAEYLKVHTEIIKQLVRVLSDKGNICWQVGNYVKNGEVFPLDIFYYKILNSVGLKYRNRIIWHFGHGLHCTKRFSGRYETILWYSKTDNYIFPGKKEFVGSRLPVDLARVVDHAFETLLWDIPNVKNNHPEKTIHPCQFPIELVERCVLALSNPGSIVLDPFSGVFSTVLAALKNNRKAIGIEKEKAYCIIGEEKINELKAGRLKTRPMTKIIHVPK